MYKRWGTEREHVKSERVVRKGFSTSPHFIGDLPAELSVNDVRRVGDGRVLEGGRLLAVLFLKKKKSKDQLRKSNSNLNGNLWFMTKHPRWSYITDEVGGPLGAFNLQSSCGDPGCSTQVVQVRAINVLQQKRTHESQNVAHPSNKQQGVYANML